MDAETRAAGRYLLARVGAFALLIPARQLTRVEAADGPADVAAPAAVDLRTLLALPAAAGGARIHLRTGAGEPLILGVDGTGSLHALPDADFCPLPPALGYARGLFDAVCRSPVEGLHALRLRPDPLLVPLPGTPPVRGA
jgi:hypothetical protein